jgi:hypothetical protein
VIAFHDSQQKDTTQSPHAVAGWVEAFQDDSVAEGVAQALGVPHPVQSRRNPDDGTFHDSQQKDTTQSPHAVAGWVEACSDGVVSDIGVVKGEVFGNEISNQKHVLGV